MSRLACYLAGLAIVLFGLEKLLSMFSLAWGEHLGGCDEAARVRHIADFIAGMTDRYALAEHARLFDSTPELR